LFAAISDGPCCLTGVLDSADVRSTMDAVRALGVDVTVVAERRDGLELRVHGWGTRGPLAPRRSIDCGNSGTTARLLMGVLAGWDIIVTLDGDESLQRRPMARVTDPLSAMGAHFLSSSGDHLPITVEGGPLRALHYELPVASAQVKTAVLLAGLRARGRTTVSEPAASRDHTERLLPAFGVGVGRDLLERSCWVEGPTSLMATDLSVPGDPSSAAFLAGAAALVPGSEVLLPEVALNPTRTGFVRVLQAMGADVGVEALRAAGAEPVGRLRVAHAEHLRGVRVPAEEAPSLIDEVPLLSVVATQARGTTRFEGVGELRVKESDRLTAIVEALGALGATARSGQDWLEVDGPARLRGSELSSLGDHRLAMAWAVAALVADGPVMIERWEAVDVSYPRFAADMGRLSEASEDAS
jgi:3-phosphoshikimate 1-carboxyvinyltransferase